MNQPPLDLVTAQAVRDVIRDSHRNGTDAAEALHKAGLIMSPAKRRYFNLVMLQELITMMKQWRPAEYLRRVNKERAPTPKDMYDAIFGYLSDYVEQMEKQQ